jgi:hypothetical protein
MVRLYSHGEVDFSLAGHIFRNLTPSNIEKLRTEALFYL